jgi:hypothetical protein
MHRQAKKQARQTKLAQRLLIADTLKQLSLKDYSRKHLKIPDEKPNIPWGDNIANIKMDSHCQVVFLNVNGISHRENYAKLFELGKQSIDYDIDLLCIVEHKLNMQNKDVFRSCETISKRYHNQTKVITSSATPIECNAKYQPGGTATIVNDPYMG